MALSARSWLDELYADANRVPAGHRLRNDLAIALRWLGLKNFSDIRQEHYELWSAGFVCYLAEGKAPSASLSDQFRAFSKWAREDPPPFIALDDDIRRVFGRLLSLDAGSVVPSYSLQQSLLRWLIPAVVITFIFWLSFLFR